MQPVSLLGSTGRSDDSPSICSFPKSELGELKNQDLPYRSFSGWHVIILLYSNCWITMFWLSVNISWSQVIHWKITWFWESRERDGRLGYLILCRSLTVSFPTKFSPRVRMPIFISLQIYCVIKYSHIIKYNHIVIYSNMNEKHYEKTHQFRQFILIFYIPRTYCDQFPSPLLRSQGHWFNSTNDDIL